ncbi:hypothetical protein RHSIM_Rhsim06G0112300 [Rhododendron simsii]|uniref:Tyrosine-protein kinase catalytic domain-containing protein n=1 Tax=Rhododendron simsii TaxID=118357 RepID=A0A834LMI1_RHOSS|nr:hypothetical protein RHSIM_Rhsim06G0112300 [Rhododendron simsii]
MMVSVLLLFFFLLAAGVGAGAQDKSDECIPRRCGDKGPEIRFPFWLKDLQPERCGYGPGFALTCSPTNTTETLLDNPFSVKVTITEINYYSQLIRYEFSGNYVPEDQQNLSLIFNTSPGYPLRVESLPISCEYHIFSCPSSLAHSYNENDYAPLPWLRRPGHSFYLLKSEYFIRRTLLNCSKMYTIPSAPCLYLREYQYSSDGLRDWSAWSEPSCRKCEQNGKYCRSSRSNHSKKNETECFDPRGATTSLLVTGLIPTSLFVLVIVLVIAIYFAHRTDNKKEDHVKVKTFLEKYRALKPTRYTYAEIKKITHNFKDKLGQGGYRIVYKGELSKDVPIAAKILNNFTGNGDDFINEVGTIGTIHHVNVIRLVGYCADGNFGNVSHKSDVYSFGMLLLEMVGGRKKNIDVRAKENSDEVYFPEWIYNRLNREEVNNNEAEEGGDARIVKKLTVVGLWCIQWYPGDWPPMKVVVQMLEVDGDTLAMPPNPFSTTNGSITRGNMGGKHFSNILEIISESN